MRALALVALVLLAACTGPGRQEVFHPEVVRGPADGPAGRVLTLTATCGGFEAECRANWAPTVDQIVMSSLEFRGYATIDPTTLRKSERSREEHIEEQDSRSEHESSEAGGGIGFIGIIPFGGGGASSSHSLSVSHTRHKTVHLVGASFEDLRLEDRRALMQLAGADTVATTRVVVGPNVGAWTIAQNVEVVVKLAHAESGAMLWASRCTASSQGYPTVEAAIENAARCAASAFAAAR